MNGESFNDHLRRFHWVIYQHNWFLDTFLIVELCFYCRLADEWTHVAGGIPSHGIMVHIHFSGRNRCECIIFHFFLKSRLKTNLRQRIISIWYSAPLCWSASFSSSFSETILLGNGKQLVTSRVVPLSKPNNWPENGVRFKENWIQFDL